MGHVRLIGLLPKNFSRRLSRPQRGGVLTAQQVNTLVEDAAARHILKIDTVWLHNNKTHNRQQQAQQRAQQRAQEGNLAQACVPLLHISQSTTDWAASTTEHACSQPAHLQAPRQQLCILQHCGFIRVNVGQQGDMGLKGGGTVLMS